MVLGDLKLVVYSTLQEVQGQLVAALKAVGFAKTTSQEIDSLALGVLTPKTPKIAQVEEEFRQFLELELRFSETYGSLGACLAEGAEQMIPRGIILLDGPFLCLHCHLECFQNWKRWGVAPSFAFDSGDLAAGSFRALLDPIEFWLEDGPLADDRQWATMVWTHLHQSLHLV
jgi:hypothetical protein